MSLEFKGRYHFLIPILMLFIVRPAFATQSVRQEQLEAMLHDRPNMTAYFDSNNARHELLVTDAPFKYALVIYGSKHILWDPNPTTPAANGNHTYPAADILGRIRISPTYNHDGPVGMPMDFENLWKTFFFEAFNMENAKLFAKSLKRALTDNTYTRSQYVLDNARIEYSAILKLRRFYLKVILPWAKRKNIKLTPKLWGVGVPENSAAWIKLYNSKNGYPWNYWGRYFDESIVPYRQRLSAYLNSCPHLLTDK